MCKRKKPMLILVEGVEASGKTTVCEFLSRDLHIENVIEFKKEENWKESYRACDDYIEICNRDTILENYMLREVANAYDKNNQNINELLYEYGNKLEHDLTCKFDVILIYLNTDTETLRERYFNKRLDFNEEEVIDKQNRYRQALENTSLSYIELDTGLDSLEQCLGDIKYFIKNR